MRSYGRRKVAAGDFIPPKPKASIVYRKQVDLIDRYIAQKEAKPKKETKKRPREEQQQEEVPTPLELARMEGDFKVDLLYHYCKSTSQNNEERLKLLSQIAKRYYDNILVVHDETDSGLWTDQIKIDMKKELIELNLELLKVKFI